MKLATLFEEFDQLADSPEALENIRAAILRLAVRGRLSKADRADEPVFDLIERLSKARASRSKKPSTGNGSELVGDRPLDRAFEIPAHWAWVPLNEIGVLSGGMTPSKTKSNFWDGEVQWFSPKDIKSDELLDSELKITATAVRATGLQVYPPGCLFLVARSGILKRTFPASINRVEATVNQDLKVLVPFVPGLERYLQIMFRGMTDFILTSLVKTGMTVQSLKYVEFERQPFPLPPLAEQKRIVAKVDELMALSDRLEAQLRERDQRKTALTHASVARFAEVPNTVNLNYLFHDSYIIDPGDLRKCILKLAVQGKLVRQDPKDEAATSLIDRVAEDLPMSSSKNPFLDAIDPVITRESEYELPQGWAWLPLGHVGIWASGCGFPTQYQVGNGGEFLFCKVSDMNLPGNEMEIRRTVNSIDADVMKKIKARANPAGSIVFPKIGGAIATHKRRLVIRPTIIDNNCSGLQPIGLTDSKWLHLLMRTIDLTRYQSGTSIPAVSQGALDPIRIGLPPLAEQRRIVSKAAELTALLDKMDTRLVESKTTATNLMNAVLAELAARA